MVDFTFGLRVAKIKHKNHLQVLRQAVVAWVVSRQTSKQEDVALLGAGCHVTP